MASSSTSSPGDMRSTLSSCHFVVLGGSGNVGSGVVAAALLSSASVVVVSRTSQKFSELKSTLDKHAITTAKLTSVVGNFHSDAEATEVAKKCVEACSGRIDHVVSNLGAGHFAPGGPTAPDSSVNDMLKNFEDGLFLAFNAAKAFIPFLRSQLNDVSYTFSQSAAIHQLYSLNSWAASIKQHAINGLMLALAKENENSKVRINSVCIHFAVAAIGQTKNQRQIDGLDTRYLAEVFMALAISRSKRGQNICVDMKSTKEVAQAILNGN